MPDLFAKSGEGARTLVEHHQDVRVAGNAIMAALGSDTFSPTLNSSSRLQQELELAALLHDLMKATSAFQLMVSTGQNLKQPIRHEVLVAVLLFTHAPLADWLAQIVPDEADRLAIVWAIAGHHLQMPNPSRPDPSSGQPRPMVRGDSELGRFTAFLSHPNVSALLTEASGVFDLKTEVPRFSDIPLDTADDEDNGLRRRARRFEMDSVAAWKRLARQLAVGNRIALLKSLLIAADVAGSAVTERGEQPDQWVSKALGVRLSADDLTPVVQAGTKGRAPHRFQIDVGASATPVTLVAAGCGNGKTTAAYLWAQRWGAGKKLFFTYPTTGTATAGFEGYLADQHDLLTELIHMRAAVDLEAIRGTPEDRDEAAARIESLRVWDRKVVVCTVDTVLGLLQAQRRPLYSFPAFAVGAFVFDEIHSYDRKLFGGLLRFLTEFPEAPALIMSASIPPGRLAQLKAVLGERAGKVIPGDQTLEGHERYLLERRDGVAPCWRDVASALTNGKKVLWVCNTVADAIQTARDAVKWTMVKPIVYHSRFRYRDRAGDKNRRGRQREVVGEFEYQTDDELRGQRKKPGPSLVIATQVCEMSLDISADVLVTAECPLPALVQRLGRLNRYASADDPWPALVYPFHGLPYNEDVTKASLYGDFSVSMKATRDVVNELTGKSCSQRDLAQCLDAMLDNEKPDTTSMLFDGGWITHPMPVREGGDEGVTVIWSRDLSEITTMLGPNRQRWAAGKLVPWTIPMNAPPRKLLFTEYAGPYPLVGDSLEYSIQEGGQWKRN